MNNKDIWIFLFLSGMFCFNWPCLEIFASGLHPHRQSAADHDDLISDFIGSRYGNSLFLSAIVNSRPPA